MAINYAQTNTDSGLNAVSFCAGSSDGGSTFIVCNGTLGSGTRSVSVTASATLAHTLFQCVIVNPGTSWDAGTWTTRLNVTTANMNLTLTEIHICRMDSSHNNVSTIGSVTGLSISLGSTGVITQNVTGVAVGSPAVDDYVLVIYTFANGAMSSQTFTLTRNQNISSPFNTVTFAGDEVSNILRVLRPVVMFKEPFVRVWTSCQRLVKELQKFFQTQWQLFQKRLNGIKSLGGWREFIVPTVGGKEVGLQVQELL